MKLQLFSLLVVVPFFCQSQNVIKNGLKEGLWETYENDSLFRIICYYANDTLDGKYVKIRISTGKKIFEANYSKGLLQGPFQYYSTSGKLEKEGSFYDGKINGISKLYDLKGHLMYYVTYDNGILNGQCESYYWSGKVEHQFSYKNGIRSDTSIWYHPSGEYSCKIIKGSNQIPQFFQLEKLRGKIFYYIDIETFLSDHLENYFISPIYKKNLFSKEKIWVGFRYNHKSSKEKINFCFVSNGKKNP